MTLTQTWGTAPPTVPTRADWIAYISGGGATLTGTWGTSDVANGAITSDKTLAGPHFFAAAAGTANALTVSLPIAPTLATGLWLWFTASATNTTAATLNVNGTGVKTIKKWNGADLQLGDILTGQACLVFYDGTNYILSSPVGKPTRIYGGTAGGTSDVLTLTLTPSTLTLTELTGTEIEFTMPASANTTAVTLTLNALTAKAVTRNGATALVAGDLAANQKCRVVYDGTQFQLVTPTTPPGTVATAAIGSATNLVVRTSTPAATRVSIAADELVVKTTAGASLLLSSVSTFADIGASGAGGLDTGAEANSTWYYIYAIYNPASGTVNALLSTSATAPTMPSGYTYKALVGAVYNLAGGDFNEFHQVGRDVDIVAVSVFTGNSPTVFTQEDISDAVPPIAKQVSGTLGNTAGGAFPISAMFSGSDSFTGCQSICVQSAGIVGVSPVDPFYTAVPYGPITLRVASKMYWCTTTTRACVLTVRRFSL